MHSQHGTSDREMENLPDRGVAEVVGRECVVRFWSLLRGSPADNPDFWLVGSNAYSRRQKVDQQNNSFVFECLSHARGFSIDAEFVGSESAARISSSLERSRASPTKETSLSYCPAMVRRHLCGRDSSEFISDLGSAAGHIHGRTGPSEHDGSAGDPSFASGAQRKRESCESRQLRRGKGKSICRDPRS